MLWKLWSCNTRKLLFWRFTHWKILLFALWLMIWWLLKKVILQSFICKLRLFNLQLFRRFWWNMRTWGLCYFFFNWPYLSTLNILFFFFCLIRYFRISFVLKWRETIIWFVWIDTFLRLRLIKNFSGRTVSDKACLTNFRVRQHFLNLYL